MLDRLLITLLILSGLAISWFAWQRYKPKLIRSVHPAEAPTGLPTLIYFTADYCAPCKLQQTPIIEQLSAKFGQAVVIRKYDVSEHPDLASRYKVLTVPTTVVLDQQGYVAHINYGVTDQAKLEAQLA
jgi:thioredoxin 1